MKRRALSTGAAAALLAAGAWLAAAACLNPMPEEFPSNDDAPDIGGGLESDNPSVNGPDDSASPTGPGNPPSPSAPSPGASEAPPSADGEAGPADAGPPDAGPRAPESCTDADAPPETGEPPE